MVTLTKNRYNTDYDVPPGEILQETLEARGMKKTEFAERCGLSTKTVSQIINGKAPISPESAIQFERILYVSATVWNNLDAVYRLHIAEKIDQRKLQSQINWSKKFPIKELVNRGFINKPNNPIDRVKKILDFFRVGNIDAWEDRFIKINVAYRESKSFKSEPISVVVWLRIGEILAERIDSNPYNQIEFKKALNDIRTLTLEPPEIFFPKIEHLFAEAGVALTFVPELPKTRLSGSARWLTKDKALIILSLRHRTEDHFWFTLFHEAGHILLHGKKKLFIDDEI